MPRSGGGGPPRRPTAGEKSPNSPGTARANPSELARLHFLSHFARPRATFRGPVMSLFGKVLAFLNVLGVLGLAALASMDYARRQAWAYAVFRHDLVVDGLPLDRQATDDQGRPLYEKVGEQTQK